MTTTPCPACGKPLGAGDINIKEGVALCPWCGKLSRLAEVADGPALDANLLTAPPPAGCSYDQQPGGLVVRASLRSLTRAMPIFFFALIWNGITSVFVLIALSGLYAHFIGPLPAWFPAPGHSDKKGNLGPDMPLGMTLFLCVFLIPFVTIGIATFLTFLTSVMGRVEVIVSGVEGRVRTGFGPFHWTRRFDATAVKRVAGGETSYQVNNRAVPVIRIEADRVVKFGSMLPDERRAWMMGVLHLLLVAPRRRGV